MGLERLISYLIHCSYYCKCHENWWILLNNYYTLRHSSNYSSCTGDGDFILTDCRCSRSQFSSVQLLSCVRLFVTPWTAASQASLSITSSQSFLKLISIGWVMPSNQFLLCRPLLLPPSVFPSIRVFSNESVLHIR